MSTQEKYMRKCLELARKGERFVAPNPMVGSVIVLNNEVIGEGFHEKYGEAHAEVNAIRSVQDQELLREATLYVNLEPCSHHGKTPPCADLIIEKKIRKVVIGSVDTNSLVSGQGIEKLRKAGIEVISGVLEKECRELNKRFFTHHEKKRPYIILKWAQTADGFIDHRREHGSTERPLQISGDLSLKLIHRWRSEEQAIMVGTNTALLDDPRLTVREFEGPDPIRITLDKWLRIPRHYHLFDQSVPTIIFTGMKEKSLPNLEFITIDFEKDAVRQILSALFSRNIRSVLVEGGTLLLNSFLSEGLWDEARVFYSGKKIGKGVAAPEIKGQAAEEMYIGDDVLKIYKSSL